MAAEFQLSNILLFFIWLIFPTILFRLILRNRSRISRLPPSPLALPIVGHMHLIARISHGALHKLSKRYGPLMHLRLGSVPCVVASSSEIARLFLKTHDLPFCNRPNTSIVDHYITYGAQDFTFAPYGPYWKFMKRVCMSELLNSKTLDLLRPIRRDEIARFVEFLSRKGEAHKAVDVTSELVRLTFNVISRMAIRRRCSSETEISAAAAADDDDRVAGEIKKSIQDMLEIKGMFNVSDFIWFLKHLDFQGLRKKSRYVRGRFDNMIEKVMKEHQEARMMTKLKDGEVKDLLDILLEISEDESSQIKLSRENIKAFLLNIFAAGVGPSAVTIEWALAELINHPAIMKKAMKEIDSVVGNGRMVEESDIANLPYLQAIAKETLRLHPPATIIKRESSEECEIGGYHIPAKTRLFINVWAIGRDPDHWENPLQFCPERFLCDESNNGIESQTDVKGQHFHYLPFGSGRRGCPGSSLGLQVMQTCLAAMIQRFEWKISSEEESEVDMKEGVGNTLHREQPLICFPVIRHNQPQHDLFT